jgi:4-hydroxy-3-methylbut-2-enyl diphosphate reductase
MKVIVGKSSGFCSGVHRAIKGATNALEEHKKVYCFGEIIHNPVVVNTLKDMGMVVVNDIERVPDRSWFVIRSHGLQNEIYKRAVEKELKIFDFTCPKVKKIHHLVTELTNEGCFILIIGNPSHPEVKAILSLARGNARVIEKPGDLKNLDFSELYAVVVQTTFNPDAFLAIVDEIILFTKKTVIYNTLCEETIKRQKESRRLAN